MKRTKCPTCNRGVRVNQDGRIRQHQRDLTKWILGRPIYDSRACPGGGELAAWWQIVGSEK